jgi:signal transduction histidine kinase
MRALINDLLAYSRVTLDAKPFEPVSLSSVASDVVSDLEELIRQKEGDVDLGPLPTIEADRLQMYQLFQNLIGNGLKFHNALAHPVVRLSAQMLPADTPVNQEEISASYEIAVTDNGIGFDETERDRIFQMFQRLHGRNEFEGTGMGLAICRKIVERHHGQITARSQRGQGSTFLVTLPARHHTEDA